MLKFKKLTFLASLFMVGMLLLAACGAEEPTQAPAEEAIDTQATVEAAAAEVEEEMAEESNVASDSESSSENQTPTTLSEVPRISAEELKERLDNGDAIVVADTRQENQYDAKHIAGAISVPSLLAESPLDELALDHEIVLYCT